jgi:hypothetical protein
MRLISPFIVAAAWRQTRRVRRATTPLRRANAYATHALRTPIAVGKGPIPLTASGVPAIPPMPVVCRYGVAKRYPLRPSPDPRSGKHDTVSLSRLIRTPARSRHPRNRDLPGIGSRRSLRGQAGGVGTKASRQPVRAPTRHSTRPATASWPPHRSATRRLRLRRCLVPAGRCGRQVNQPALDERRSRIRCGRLSTRTDRKNIHARPCR